MSTPRPATRLNSSSRPLSAIFVGKIDVNKEPTSTERTLQLPSPPHTNSNDGGSTGDSGTVGRKGLSPTGRISPNMSHRDERGKRPASRSTYYDDEDELDEVHDLPNEYDEDHTARMSDDRRSTGTGSSGSAISRSSGNSSGALSRARTLADRNRRVLDKLAAITTGSRTTRLASISRHHKPLTQELSAPTTHTSREGGVSPSPSRLSLSHSRSDKELVSGSDTEKERMSSDDHSITPTTGPSRLSEGKESVRRHADSDPSSSETHSSTIRRSLDLHHEHSSNSKPLPRDTEAEGEESQVTSSFNTSRNKRNSRRAPLPSSFRDSSHSHAETVR
ncbi:uncharacterized protein EI90DRAFT_2279933 [Cantharellus anzutake]|uniref:uncharacterized protein n=1 Tax=Cantharellus anzutake TaxID=1750568 RepID=UPI001903410D|nr:uncharacterized protein EI90DRAFT_2279933 [Cantharellus anzutake]KAF8339748.1 hypothetical protein EI90DRAFT_2279933 [Cantharellus anzutake]